MAKLHVERIGGLANFGGERSHIRSHGEIDMEALSGEDQRIVEELFGSRAKERRSQARDAFRYRITRVSRAGAETVEVPEEAIPAALSQCVKDELV